MPPEDLWDRATAREPVMVCGRQRGHREALAGSATDACVLVIPPHDDDHHVVVSSASVLLRPTSLMVSLFCLRSPDEYESWSGHPLASRPSPTCAASGVDCRSTWLRSSRGDGHSETQPCPSPPSLPLPFPDGYLPRRVRRRRLRKCPAPASVDTLEGVPVPGDRGISLGLPGVGYARRAGHPHPRRRPPSGTLP
jgi:hypothetical protein